MVLTVNGIDMIPYIAYGGLKWQRSDVDGPNAGRTLDGEMNRDRVATKIRWDVTCRPVTSSELAKILQAIEPEYVTVTYMDPTTNKKKNGTFYSNNIPAQFLMVNSGGVEYWTGLTFPLIQK